jgi:hypothetical protein
MYEKLKQIMREAGYAVSEGAEWLATDMQHFATFSRHVLGSTTTHLNHVLAYPEAFPHMMAKASELAQGVVSKVEELVEDVAQVFEAPTATQMSAPAEPAPVAEPTPLTPPADTSTLDVSASGQTEKQDLNPTPAAEQAVDNQEQPAAQAEQPQDATGDAVKTGDESTEPPAHEDAEKPVADQPTEGQSQE